MAQVCRPPQQEFVTSPGAPWGQWASAGAPDTRWHFAGPAVSQHDASACAVEVSAEQAVLDQQARRSQSDQSVVDNARERLHRCLPPLSSARLPHMRPYSSDPPSNRHASSTHRERSAAEGRATQAGHPAEPRGRVRGPHEPAVHHAPAAAAAEAGAGAGPGPVAAATVGGSRGGRAPLPGASPFWNLPPSPPFSPAVRATGGAHSCETVK
jgi:hypothetical protein